MRLIALSLAAIAAATAFAESAAAQSVSDPSRFSVGAAVGTNGGVVEVTYQIDDHFVLRGQGAFVDFSHGFSSKDARYSGDAHFNTGGVSLDWHPFANAFLLGGGVISGDRIVNVSAHATKGSITVDGVTYSASQIGAVYGDIDYGSTVPVAGIGYDNTYVGNHHWGFRALLGVEFGREPPLVALHAVGPLAEDPTVVSDVRGEQHTLSRDAGDFSYYPVAQLGLTYRF
jgi:hypothetical protein